MTRLLIALTMAVLSLLSPSKPGIDETNGHGSDTTLGFLLLSEISPWDTAGPWVEIINPSDEAVSLNQWSVQFQSGAIIHLDSCGESIESNSVILVQLDGSPAPAYDDACALIYNESVIDAMSWGNPGELTLTDQNIGLPVFPEAEYYNSNNPLFSDGDVFIRMPGTWDPELQNSVGNHNWTHRTGSHASPGEINSQPGPWIMTPVDGTRVASDFTLGVAGLEWSAEIQFQVSNDPAFSNIILDALVRGFAVAMTDFAPGDYYWRVRAVNHDWSPAQTFTVADFNIDDLIANFTASSGNETLLASADSGAKAGGSDLLGVHHMIGINHLTQYKDTDMLCLDGCNMNGQLAWDTMHPSTLHAGGHNRKYCMRACLAMAAGQYGNTLSQDRISYYIFEEVGPSGPSAALTGHVGDPYGDLGHGRGSSQDDAQLAFNWIYDAPSGSSQWWVNWPDRFYNPTPAMDSIREFIDDDRPVIRTATGHATLIDGYAIIKIDETTTESYVHILDPWYHGPTSQMWLLFQPALAIDFITAPSVGRPSRSDEPELSMDSDADGINDFDEIHRFHTDPNSVDTDVDGVYDKQDMLGYLFSPDGLYNPGERDFDADSYPKELDPDADRASDDGSRDGCEDANGNGFYDEGGRETSNFNSNDEFDVINPDCLRGIIRWEVRATRHDAEIDLDYHYLEEVKIQPGSDNSGEYEHPHLFTYDFELHSIQTWSRGHDRQEGLARAILEFEEASGEYFLTLDVDTPDSNVVIITDSFGHHLEQATPFEYEFANDGRWPLGPPQEVDGGLVCKGEWERPAAAGAYGPMRLTWEIWITAPSG